MELAILLVFLANLLFSPLGEAQPQQIHLAYGYEPDQMVVMWSTAESSSSVVLYGLSPYYLTAKESGIVWEFTDGNPDGLHYVHKVVLKVPVSMHRRYSGFIVYTW